MKKKIIAFLIFILVFGLAAYALFYLYVSGRPTPVSADQVITSLNEQGFQPQDITDSAQDNFPGFGLESCVVTEQNGIRFEFYRFDNVESARKVYQQAHSKIFPNKTNQAIVFEERKLNYHIYILDVGTTYYLAMYVENTAIYAYCTPAKNSDKINSILTSFGYMNSSGGDWHEDSPLDGIIRVAVYVLCIPIMHITRLWIWPVLYKSAGVPRSEALELWQRRKEVIPKLICRSKSPGQTKFFAVIYNYISFPAYIAVILAIIGCFTDRVENVLDVVGFSIPVIMIGCALVFNIINKVYTVSKSNHAK